MAATPREPEFPERRGERPERRVVARALAHRLLAGLRAMNAGDFTVRCSRTAIR